MTKERIIGRLGDYIKEYSVRNKDGEDIPVYSVTNSNGFCTEYFDKEVASKDQSNYKIVPRGYFAYNPSRINVGSIDYQKEQDKVVVSPLYVVFGVDERIDKDYLLYYLKSEIGQTYIRELASGSVRANLKFSILQDFPIPMVSLEKQKEYVKRIKKIDSILEICDEMERVLEDTVQARFVEMFGTLEKPSGNFKWDTLKNLCNKITDGKHGGCIQENGTGRYFVGAREIYDNMVHYETAPEINIEEFEKDYKRCNIEKGDFLIVNTGATIGKSAIATDDRTEYTLLQKSVALLKTKSDLLHPIFLKYCYTVNAKMYKVESASAQPNLLLSQINGTEIYVPPIGLQKQFSEFVAQIGKSKLVLRLIRERIEKIKVSLIQKYYS